MTDPAAPAEFEKHRDYLYRYALLQIRDGSHADDMEQETLLAAMESGSNFAGRSSLRTWLTGILRHKIIDLFRRQSRETQVPVAPDGEDERDFAGHFFLTGPEPTTGILCRRPGRTPNAVSSRNVSGKRSTNAMPSSRPRPRACSRCES